MACKFLHVFDIGSYYSNAMSIIDGGPASAVSAGESLKHLFPSSIHCGAGRQNH